MTRLAWLEKHQGPSSREYLLWYWSSTAEPTTWLLRKMVISVLHRRSCWKRLPEVLPILAINLGEQHGAEFPSSRPEKERGHLVYRETWGRLAAR